MATLSIENKFSVTLDSGTSYAVDLGGTVTNVGEVINRELEVPITEVTLLNIGATVAAGTLTDIKFCVIKNLDDTNFIRVRLEDTSGHTSDHKIAAGDYIVVFNTKLSVSETGAAFSAFSDIDTISAQADTSPCLVAVFAGESC
jgi:hypothetical protein